MKKVLGIGAVLCAIFVFAGALTSCKDTVSGTVVTIGGLTDFEYAKLSVKSGTDLELYLYATPDDIEKDTVYKGTVAQVKENKYEVVLGDVDAGYYYLALYYTKDNGDDPHTNPFLVYGNNGKGTCEKVFVTTGKSFDFGKFKAND